MDGVCLWLAPDRVLKPPSAEIIGAWAWVYALEPPCVYTLEPPSVEIIGAGVYYIKNPLVYIQWSHHQKR